MSKPEVERQKSPNLGFWGRIGLESLWIFCKFFSILPYWFRYYVVEPAVFGALRLLRYRYRVVTENLRNSFPEKSLLSLYQIPRTCHPATDRLHSPQYPLYHRPDMLPHRK